MARAGDPQVPVTSLVLGFGAMLPLVAAGLGCWTLGGDWPLVAIRLALIWGALVLAFVAGVRRGFGFGRDRAGTAADVATAAVYFALAGLSLVLPRASVALAVLIVGYLLAALLDAEAARRGDAPRHFARLRPMQLLLAAAGLAACWAWLVH